MKWQEVKPVKKVELPAFAGAASTFGWWLAQEIAQVEPPAAVVAASVVLIMAVVGWFAPSA